MARLLIKFIIYQSFDRTLKHGMVKSEIFRKSSLNFSFGQGTYLISGTAWPDLVKAILLQASIRLEIVIFNNNFAFCQAGFLKLLMISFCSMP